MASKRHDVGTLSSLRTAANIRDSHSSTPHNSKWTRIFWHCPRVRAQSYATKLYSAVKRPQVTRVERIGPVPFCAACGCAAANHSSDNSRRGLLTKWKTGRSSPIQQWRDELTCIKSEKSSRIYASMNKSMYNIHLRAYYNRDDRRGDGKGPE